LIFKGSIAYFSRNEYDRVTGREIGYAYFQDFIPGNDHDIRIIVIGDKAFAIKRLVRKKDFRASGSGFVYYGKNLFKEETVRLAFEMSEKLASSVLHMISYSWTETTDPRDQLWFLLKKFMIHVQVSGTRISSGMREIQSLRLDDRGFNKRIKCERRYGDS